MADGKMQRLKAPPVSSSVLTVQLQGAMAVLLARRTGVSTVNSNAYLYRALDDMD